MFSVVFDLKEILRLSMVWCSANRCKDSLIGDTMTIWLEGNTWWLEKHFTFKKHGVPITLGSLNVKQDKKKMENSLLCKSKTL